jgi:multidrug resistance efflux pump
MSDRNLLRWLGGRPLALALVTAACAAAPAVQAPQGDPAGPEADAGTPIVRRGTFVRRVLLTGELKAVRAHEILVPRTPQWQVSIRWMEADGATVAAGQKVLELDNSSVAANLEERRLAVAHAADELERQQAQAAATLAEKEYTLVQRRIELEKAQIDADVPAELLSGRDLQDRRLAERRARVEFEKAEDDLASTRRGCEADVAVARITLEKAQREVTSAESSITSLSITAPTAGILQIADHPWEGRKLQIGDNVWSGMTALRIPDLTEMQVDGVLFDVDDGQIALGAPARCTADTYPDETFAGNVTGITPMAQELRRGTQRRAFHATVALTRTDPERLRPGMSVKVEIDAERRDGVLIAPRTCLSLAAGGDVATLATGRGAPVRLGPCSALECVVESGIEEGAKLRPAAGGDR